MFLNSIKKYMQLFRCCYWHLVAVLIKMHNRHHFHQLLSSLPEYKQQMRLYYDEYPATLTALNQTDSEHR